MQNAGQSRVLDYGRFPGRWEILRSTAATDGELLEMRLEIEATEGDSPPVHTHPNAEEAYEVLSGVLEVHVEGRWESVRAGETHAVSAGTPHTFRNTERVELINVHTPALEFERFFRRFHKLVTERGVRLPPRNFKSAVLVGMLFSAHKQEIVSVKPPDWSMKGLAKIGKLVGYRLPDVVTSTEEARAAPSREN